MSEYIVMFSVKVSADSNDELWERTDNISKKLSKSLKKKVEPYGFYEVEKKDTIKQSKLY